MLDTQINGGGRNMDTTIERWSTSEIPVVLRFLHARGCPST